MLTLKAFDFDSEVINKSNLNSAGFLSLNILRNKLAYTQAFVLVIFISVLFKQAKSNKLS